ncbi:MAG: acylphosphatase [Archaeoglobales archaeon]|nr:acylphosphatase [Archaeoglobales archaeon]
MAIRITIKGKVHEVGYRLFLLEEADSLFIPCFDARNVKINGKEALIVLVDGEKEQLEQFIEFVKSNKPENAVVEEISVEEFKGRVRDIEKFRASFNTSQLSKIVQVGVKMLEKQDKMLEKQDETIKKIEEVGRKVEEVGRKVDQTREELGRKIEEVGRKVDQTKEELGKKIDETNEKLEMLRSDFRDYLETNLREINSRISRIEDALRRAGIM